MGVITASREQVEWAISILDRVGDGEAVAVSEQEFFQANALLSAVAISAFGLADEVARLEAELEAMSPGARRIAAERQRQLSEEGWTPEHDDQHTAEQLASAAAFYVLPEKYGELLAFWPWDEKYNKKRQHNRIKQLTIAGALIAAEIDRLLRREQS